MASNSSSNREEAVGAQEKREVYHRRKAHVELWKALNDVSDEYAAMFPSYEKLGALLKQHAASETLGLSKSAASVLLQVSDTLDDLATMQAVRAGEVRNTTSFLQTFDGGVQEHHSVCTTVEQFISEEFDPVAAGYAAAESSYDTEHKQETTRAGGSSDVHAGNSKLSQMKVQLDLEQQHYDLVKQELAQHMRSLDHKHAAILKRGIGDLIYGEMGMHCRAMQMHANLYPYLDEMWPDTTRLTGSVNRGHWVDGWVHNFLRTSSPEAYSYSVPASADPSAGEEEKQVVPYWLRAGTAAGSQGAPKGCSLVSVKPRAVSWVGQLKLDDPDLGWYHSGASANLGDDTRKEIRQVVNRRGVFDKKKKAMGNEFKVRYVNGDEPDAWVPEDPAGELRLRFSLQDAVCEAWADRRAALLERIDNARAAGQGLESLHRELLIHDQDAWQTVAGWAAHRGASVASLPAKELVETYARDREARGKNRVIVG
eukprot:COSAG02_NODE_95_length_37416_cov_60.512742_10_plen_483_part_00